MYHRYFSKGIIVFNDHLHTVWASSETREILVKKIVKNIESIEFL